MYPNVVLVSPNATKYTDVGQRLEFLSSTIAGAPSSQLALTMSLDASSGYQIEDVWVAVEPIDSIVGEDGGGKKRGLGDEIILPVTSPAFLRLSPCTAALGADVKLIRCDLMDIATGDVDGDGLDDLVCLIAVGGTGSGERRLGVFKGPFDGLTQQQRVMHSVSSLGSSEANYALATSTKVAVIGGTAGSDRGTIVVSHLASVDGGIMLVRNAAFTHESSTTVLIPNPVAETQFGRDIISCDVDNDGFYDVVVSAPRSPAKPSEATGAVVIYRGTLKGISLEQTMLINGTAGDDLFGYTLSCVDMTNDEKDDVLVASKTTITGNGQSTSGTTVKLYRSTGWDSDFVKLWSGLKPTTQSLLAPVAALPGIVLLGDSVFDEFDGRAIAFRGPFPETQEMSFLSTQGGSRGGAVLATDGVHVASTALTYMMNQTVTGAVYMYNVADLIPSDEVTTTGEEGATGSLLPTTSDDTHATALSSTNDQPADGTSTATAGLGVAETVDGSTGSSVDGRVIAGVGAAAVVVLLALVLAFVLWMRRRRGASAPVAAPPQPVGKSRRVTRGASASRLDRTSSRGTVRTRRSRAPTTSAPIQSYGETSLAVPGESGIQYAQTSLYPAPGSVRS